MKKAFESLSEWVNLHKALLTVIFSLFCAAGTAIASQVMLKDDFNEYARKQFESDQAKLELILKHDKEIEVIKMKNQLDDANWEIDHYLRQGEENLNAFELERLERARKKRDAIEAQMTNP